MTKPKSFVLVLLSLLCIVTFISCNANGGTTNTPNGNDYGSTINTHVCKHDDPTQIVTVEAVLPTCQKTGLTMGMKCNLCETMVLPQTIVNPVECVSSDWIIDKNATHTEDGKKHTECIMCETLLNQDVIPSGNKLLAYTLLPNNTYKVSGLGECKDSDIIIPNEYNGLPVTSIGGQAFKNCNSLKSITISNSVTSIGGSAFSHCTSLTDIVLGDSVTSISAYAFEDCSSLTNLVVPNSVINIDNSAFWNCSSLTNVVIGSSVTSIGTYVFRNCYKLTSIRFVGTTKQWNAISVGSDWTYKTLVTEVVCSDGTIVLN